MVYKVAEMNSYTPELINSPGVSNSWDVRWNVYKTSQFCVELCSGCVCHLYQAPSLRDNEEEDNCAKEEGVKRTHVTSFHVSGVPYLSSGAKPGIIGHERAPRRRNETPSETLLFLVLQCDVRA